MPGALVRLPGDEIYNRPRPASEGPEPGFFEGVAASFRIAEDRQDLFEQAPRNADAYRAALDSLRELGVDTSEDGPLYDTADSGTIRKIRVFNRDRVFAEMQRQRARNPQYFRDIPATREDWDRQIATRFGARERDKRVAERAGMASEFAGSIGSTLTDPVQIATLPLGSGANSLGRFVLEEALVGALGSAAMLPDAKAAMDRMGERFTGTDMALEVGSGAAGNVAFGLGGRYVLAPAAKAAGQSRAGQAVGRAVTGAARVAGDAAASAREAALARIIPHLPEALRPGISGLADIPDAAFADAFEAAVGPDNMTPDLTAALHVVRAEAQDAAANPYVGDFAGLKAHRDAMDAGMAWIMGQRPSAPVRAVAGQGSALGSGTVPAPAQAAGSGYDAAAIKARIRGPESGGNDAATNRMGSSASGRYQFVEGTFKGLWRQVYGGDADAAWKSRRFEPAVQEALMDRLLANNAAALRGQGLTVDNGNLYVMHVLGSGDGPKLLRATPDTPVAELLSAAIVRQNPSYFGGGRSVAEALDTIRAKVGDGPAARGGGLADDGSGALARAQQAMGDAEAALARSGEGQGLDADLAALGRPMSPLEPQDVPVLKPELQGAMPGEVTLAGQLRELVADRATQLNDLDGLARTLGASPDEVRTAMLELVQAKGGGVRIRKSDGAFVRRPQQLGPRGGSGPVDSIGEALHEAGYLTGADGGRPSEREVLDFIEARIQDGKPRYTLEDQARQAGEDAGAAPARDEAVPVYAEWIRETAVRDFGLDADDLTDDFLTYAAGLKYDSVEGLTEAEAFMRAVNDYGHATKIDALDESGDLRYEDIDYDWPFDNPPYRSEDIADEGDFAGFAPVGSDPAAGRFYGEDDGGYRAEPPGPIEGPAQAQLARFSDPDTSDAATWQADSLHHDLEALAAQSPDTMVTLDAEAGPVRLADAIEGIDDELKGLDAIDACLRPGGV